MASLGAWIGLPYVLISYSREDEEKVGEIVGRLRASRISCWIDRAEIAPTDLYRQKISNAIRRASCVVVFVSPSSLASNWVRHEVSGAEATGIPTIQVLLEGTRYRDLAHPFRPDADSISLHEPSRLDTEFERLVQACRTFTRRHQWRPWAVVGAMVALLLVAILLPRCVARQVVAHLGGFSLPLAGPPRPSQPPDVQDVSAAQSGAYLVSSETRKPQMVFEIFGRRKQEQEWTPVTTGRILQTGDEVFVRVDPLTPGYLYVFSLDATGKLQWLFPSNSTFSSSTGANPVAPGRKVQIPDGDKVFPLDQSTGLESVFGVFSAGRWPELERNLEAAADSSTNNAAPLPSTAEIQGFIELVSARTKGMQASVPATVRKDHISRTEGMPVRLSTTAVRAQDHWLIQVRQFQHVPAPAQ